jgi:GNAT superfamily N-acetyltransferase
MQSEFGSIGVRLADLTGPDNEAVSRLVQAYLLHTEYEKATHLGQTNVEASLPQRYHDEVQNPAQAYENSVVYLAELDRSPVGIVVVQQNKSTREIKRVWVEPSARGRHVGSALLDAALVTQDLPVRLTVWDWRHEAVRLYRARGFTLATSWDDRPRLLCMEKPELRQPAR